MKSQRTKKQSHKTTSQIIVREQDTVTHPSDLLEEPIMRLKRLQGAVTLLTHLGSRELECTDPDAILSFCELVEDHLRPSLEELDALQRALA